MQQVILEQLPLIVACVAILSGALLGKYLVRKPTNGSFLTWSAYGVLAICLLVGGNLVSLLVRTLVQSGIEQPIAATIAIAVLSFLAGLALSCVAGHRNPTKEDRQ